MHTSENILPDDTYEDTDPNQDRLYTNLQNPNLIHNHSHKGQHNFHGWHISKGISNRMHRRIKCLFFVSVFSLAFTAGAGLRAIVTHPDIRNKSQAASFFTDPNTYTENPSSTDGLRQEKRALLTSQDKLDKSMHTVSASDKWNLILVNPWNHIPESYEVELTLIQNGGHAIDTRCYPYLMQMLEDCKDAGLHPLICSSYRSAADQKSLFKERVQELKQQGYTAKNARIKAAVSVAVPGTSEHQLGLAVDIVDQYYQLLNISQESTPVQQWLMENSWKYGFILRYPSEKSDLTGIIYEPWHYRYVGKKAAKVIHKQGICLEEYLETFGQS